MFTGILLVFNDNQKFCSKQANFTLPQQTNKVIITNTAVNPTINSLTITKISSDLSF